MKTFYDCIPCFIKQTLNVSRLSLPEDEEIHGQIMKQVLAEMVKLEMDTPPPVVSSRIHRIIKQMTGNKDPYKSVKDKFNRKALDLYPQLKKYVELSENPFETVVKIAIAGNIIDFGHMATTQEIDLESSVRVILEQEPIINHTHFLEREINQADNILYLADNTGEIVFDKVFIEHLMPKNIVLVVRKYPIINDANLEDAETAGLIGLIKVIENGADVPGTYLPECSQEFKEVFESADLIISKGQGNYETLNDVDKNIFFLLKAKCKCVAEDINCQVNDIVVIGKQYAKLPL